MLPYHIRIKAINALPNFGDASVIDSILPLLENAENYVFYDSIINMILALDAMPDYENKIREASLKAASNEKELIK